MFKIIPMLYGVLAIKNVESAIAEIVDNSLEAKAKDVLIICSAGTVAGNTRFVDEIAVLDNGLGMDVDTLSKMSCYWGEYKKESEQEWDGLV